MRFRFSLGLAFAATAIFAIPAAAQSKALLAPGGQSATIRAMYSEVVVLGKVAEIEKDTVEGPAYANAPKDQKLTYKVAIVKIDEPLIGAKGLTQLRVGFPADAPAVTAPAQPPGGPGGGPIGGGRRPRAAATVALTAEMEGCFFVDPLPGADFYIVSAQGPPLNKKDDSYEKELKAVQTVVKTIDDPVGALKAKDLEDRFRAAHALLLRYQTAKGGSGRVSRESVPVDENKLILGVLAELPWLPKEAAAPGGEVAPSRSTLWYTVNWNEHGFRPPKNAPGADYNVLMEEATTAFLKENANKINLKRAVAK
jgi:hypothetical protein